MRKVIFKSKSFEEFCEWQSDDRKTTQRIVRILKECQRTPFEGIGKPEPLKGNKSGLWSRRIDEEHRLIYKAEEDFLLIYSMRGHYND